MTRALGNVAAVIACAICFVGVLLLTRRHFINCTEMTGKEAVRELLAEVSASGALTKTTYDVCVNALYLSGYDGECRVTVFTEELASDGKKRHYMISWDEIEREIFENGVYKCPEKSYVKVTIGKTVGRKTSVQKLVGESGEWTESIYVNEGAMGI